MDNCGLLADSSVRCRDCDLTCSKELDLIVVFSGEPLLDLYRSYGIIPTVRSILQTVINPF